jgi:hypothetical protein
MKVRRVEIVVAGDARECEKSITPRTSERAPILLGLVISLSEQTGQVEPTHSTRHWRRQYRSCGPPQSVASADRLRTGWGSQFSKQRQNFRSATNNEVLVKRIGMGSDLDPFASIVILQQTMAC